jgi:hypothetical protein
LKIQNGVGDIFSLTPSKVLTTGMDDDSDSHQTVPEGIVKLKFRWSQDMGIMADNDWQGGTSCMIVAKTGSNFIYRTQWFGLSWGSQAGSYDPDKKSSEMEVGTRYATTTQIN